MNFDRILLKNVNTEVQGNTRSGRSPDKDAGKGWKDEDHMEVMVAHRVGSSAQPVQGQPWPNP